MAEIIGWGILGNALIARKCVVPAIEQSTNGRIVVLGSRFPEAAGDEPALSEVPKIVEGYEAVLEAPDVQAVYIPLSNH
jgi:predicted dehydrogenase